MRLLIFLFLIAAHVCMAQEKPAKTKAKVTYHLVCNLTNDVYHNHENCAVLQQCRGGRYRRVKNVDDLTPCKRCVRTATVESVVMPKIPRADFTNIKRILGVRNKKQIADSLGTAAGRIMRPGGMVLKISGPPESETVNRLEFTFNPVLEFNRDSLLSAQLFDKMGLTFKGCQSDTIKAAEINQLTGKVKPDFTINYRGCSIIEARDAYEDTSLYYYELMFISNEAQNTILDRIQLTLRLDKL